MRALIADDDAETCCSVSNMLSEIGLRPDWTTSGKEAVLRARFAKGSNDSYGVYLIDWPMPDLNGIETVRRIRKEIEDEARVAGVSYFCTKPIFLSELREILSCPYVETKKDESKSESTLGLFGKSILLVEDNELNQEIAYEILSDAALTSQ